MLDAYVVCVVGWVVGCLLGVSVCRYTATALDYNNNIDYVGYVHYYPHDYGDIWQRLLALMTQRTNQIG